MYQEEVKQIEADLARLKQEGKQIFMSSSFQQHSLPLLHLMSRFAPDVPVYFLDTGFHFPETLLFKDFIGARFQLDIRSLKSELSKLEQRDEQGNFYFSSDPDRCCQINKTVPMEKVLAQHDIWLSGVRRDQNFNRRNFNRFMPGPFNTLRYHPMLEWDSKMIYAYAKDHELPEHPLLSKGYLSVGCEPCTAKYVDGRAGRWAGMQKTECGLHTDLVKK